MSSKRFAKELIAEIEAHQKSVCEGRQESALLTGYKLAHKHIIDIIKDKARREF